MKKLIVRFQYINVFESRITQQTFHLKKWKPLYLKNQIQTSRNQRIWKKNIFIWYCPRAVKIEPATSIKIDTEIAVFLQNTKGYVTSIFRGDEINEIYCKKQRLWIEILNKSFEETVEIKRNRPLGFLVVEPEHLKFKYETTKKKRRQTKKRTNRKRKRQLGGFLNHYDFTYAGKDIVNQAAKVAPDVIKAATNDINEIAKDRINQIMSQHGKEVERILPKILRGAIEDVYQTPFRLFSNFRKQQLNKIKRKILR